MIATITTITMMTTMSTITTITTMTANVQGTHIVVFKPISQDEYLSISQHYYEFKLSSLPFEITNNLWGTSELCHNYIINPSA